MLEFLYAKQGTHASPAPHADDAPVLATVPRGEVSAITGSSDASGSEAA